MLIHACIECASLSINRIAADDDPESVMEVFDRSLLLAYRIGPICETQGIALLSTQDAEMVRLQLYGHRVDVPALDWSSMQK
jgi:hypothetical protein